MNEWHPLPPPQMVTVSEINSQVFSAGFQAGCFAGAGVFLALLLWAVLAWSLRSKFSELRFLLFPPRALSLVVLAVLACAAPSRADTVQQGQTATLTVASSFPASGSSWAITGPAASYSSSSPGGFVVSPHGATVTVSIPVSASVGPSYYLSGASAGTGYYVYFNVSAAPPPPVSQSVCSSSYPSSVAPLLGSAPSPCAYFTASQGFNSSSAPLITAILGVLVVVLAIWLGHESVMSLFRRLVAGMTGGK